MFKLNLILLLVNLSNTVCNFVCVASNGSLWLYRYSNCVCSFWYFTPVSILSHQTIIHEYIVFQRFEYAEGTKFCVWN